MRCKKTYHDNYDSVSLKSLPTALWIDQTTLGRLVRVLVHGMLSDVQGAISAEGGRHEIVPVLEIIPFLTSFNVWLHNNNIPFKAKTGISTNQGMRT